MISPLFYVNLLKILFQFFDDFVKGVCLVRLRSYLTDKILFLDLACLALFTLLLFLLLLLFLEFASNLSLPLWQLVRASTAAPSFFPPCGLTPLRDTSVKLFANWTASLM